ncbi:Rieske (2Fe-2S) iron-sulfur domain protein [Sulfobacillus acidophilus DSM 10332]|uniref:Rieske (2Fe-2S) iron-sulfur domain protein n=1 Tax=Sulfobacillus acidophilus (strain ATCC 700253 / DSM 10332 / NAL) TaxID=679936 RepID=G8TTP8_SULAD|nr:Rieske (2Fe-2S) iron-sulfur domain protein [Sulfobacillus acidophilus DSM 10332]
MTTSAPWIRACRVDDIDPAIPYFVEINNQPLALYRVGDDVFATDDTCSHQEASLSEGSYAGYIVTCPRHGGQFDIRTGQAVKMPAVSPITVFPVKVVDGDVYVAVDKSGPLD